ncbi:SGNH/GDSL hydrolase family protein [Cohnella fermenti]|uniref:SGNH hydrolase-type esterase domain-containing protein n=1 Tax=Cohnella fermenti TaxID=2565925 RepID=A0A4S4C628_9BACL|nr:SGNH/GDSL hydrolase family protein [Cohnella fermenti]THF82698.1 hypothetical protein E6C55_06420 [Cohnella fermenti]
MAVDASPFATGAGDAVREREGLTVRETSPASLAVRVEPGWLVTAEGVRAELREEAILPIRPGGARSHRNQQYVLRGTAEAGPAGWNGDDLRGSGGAPYQRMVPGSLVVRDRERGELCIEGEDYIGDSYWGTIKARAGGKLAEGTPLSLDYEAYLCRYDAVVLAEDGSVRIVEGSTEPQEQRELLLPDPPRAADGIVLAHVFTGWGREAITSGRIALEGASAGAEVTGVYRDMTPRTYEVEVTAVDAGRLTAVIAAGGEDYGPVLRGGEQVWRMAAPATIDRGEELPLLLVTAYGRTADWGLGLRPGPDTMPGDRFIVRAEPRMIYNLALPGGSDPVGAIPIRGFDRLRRTLGKLATGEPVLIALFGESTTRWGHWPYALRDGLEKLGSSRVMTVNAAVGGENSIRGSGRLEAEVLSRRPDLVIVEYMINDATLGRPNESEQAMRGIVRRIAATGADCLIATHNGMNPLFSANGSARSFRSYHELYERIADEEGCAFAGGYALFEKLEHFGRCFLTELKGNMINHPYGNVDPRWGDFDEAVANAILRGFAEALRRDSAQEPLD